jgi:hypothetical protein
MPAAGACTPARAHTSRQKALIGSTGGGVVLSLVAIVGRGGGARSRQGTMRCSAKRDTEGIRREGSASTLFASRLHGFAVLMALRVGEEAWLMMLGD